jgi:hypothetical protein
MSKTSEYRKSRVDYTGRFGPLFQQENVEWPMYSFERPSWLFWNGVANYLRSQGKTESEIKDALQHKNMRWMLDSRDSLVESLGFDCAESYFGQSPAPSHHRETR